MRKCYISCLCVILLMGCTLNAAILDNNLVLDCTTLISPEDASIGVNPNANLVWTDVPDATGYTVRMGTQPGSGDFVNDASTASTFLDIPTMDFNTLYYVRITPFSATDIGVGCFDYTFQVGDEGIMECGSFDSPQNAATDVSIFSSFEWSPVNGATGYLFSLGSAPNQADLVNNIDVGNITSYYAGQLDYNTDYFMTLVPYGEFGVADGCFEEFFTTANIPVPPCPVIESPNNNATNVDLNTQINWLPVQGVGGYRVAVGTVPGGTDISQTVVNNGTLMNLNNLENGTVYYISVVGFNDFGESQDCGLHSFTTISLDSEISITCPDNQIINAPIGATAVPVDWMSPIVSTSCEDSVFELIQVSGLQNGADFPIGSSTIKYEVSDNCGNEGSCSFDIVVAENNLEFSVNCPTDITLLTNNEEGTVISLAEPSFTTNCETENVTITQISGPQNGTLFPVGNSTLTYELSLNCEGQNSLASCSFNVNVELQGEEEEEEELNCSEVLSGFTLLGNFDNHNYYISENNATWLEASNIAASRGGTLVSFSSAAENEFVRSKLNNTIAFIGLFQNASGNFTWDSEEAFSFDFIEISGSSETMFANMNFWSGGWAFDSEFVQRPFILEITCGETLTPPSSSLTVNCPENQTIIANDMNPVIATWEDPIVSSTCAEGSILNSQVGGQLSGSLFEVGTTSIIAYEIADDCNAVQVCNFVIKVEAAPVTGTTDCPGQLIGFTLLGEFEGHQYFTSNESTTWLKAADLANENGGYLVSINSAAENEFIRQNIPVIAFIGLSDVENEAALVWDSAEPFTYTALESNNTDGNDFGSINFWNGGWQLENEQVNRPFIIEFDCEETTSSSLSINCSEHMIIGAAEGATSIFLNWEVPTATTTCDNTTISIVQTKGPELGSALGIGEEIDIQYEISDACGNVAICEFNIQVDGFESNDCLTELTDFTFIGDFEQHTYFISNNAMEWLDAQAMATDLGGYLVAINSPDENEFIRENISEITLIGLHDQNVEGVYEWVTGEPYLPGNILDGNTEADDFGTINFWNGGWGTVSQFAKKPFIIEFECQILPQAENLSTRVGVTNAISIDQIFPNPSQVLVNVEIESTIETTTKLQIFDILGIFQKEITVDLFEGKNQASISIEELKNGIHFIQIQDDNMMIAKKKFVKF